MILVPRVDMWPMVTSIVQKTHRHIDAVKGRDDWHLLVPRDSPCDFTIPALPWSNAGHAILNAVLRVQTRLALDGDAVHGVEEGQGAGFNAVGRDAAAAVNLAVVLDLNVHF